MKDVFFDRIKELEKALSLVVAAANKDGVEKVSDLSSITRARYHTSLHSYLLNIGLYNTHSEEKYYAKFGKLSSMLG